MTFKEFGIIADAIKTYYPRDNVLPTERAMTLWYDGLKDLPYSIANVALKKYAETNKFSPTIADIREHASQIDPRNQANIINENEAWTIVWKAICNSGYHSEEEFAKLPPILQRTVGSPRQLKEWAMLEDVDGKAKTVLQTSFQRIFRIEQEREKEKRKLSPDVAKFLNEKVMPQIECKKYATVSEQRMVAEKKARPAPDMLREKVLEAIEQNK